MLLIPKMQVPQQPYPGKATSPLSPVTIPGIKVLQPVSVQNSRVMPKFGASSRHFSGTAQAEGKCDGFFRNGKAIALATVGILSAAYLLFKNFLFRAPIPPKAEARTSKSNHELTERLTRMEQGRGVSPEEAKIEVQPSASSAEPIEQMAQVSEEPSAGSTQVRRRPELWIDTRPEYLRPRHEKPIAITAPSLPTIPEGTPEVESDSDENGWVVLEKEKRA